MMKMPKMPKFIDSLRSVVFLFKKIECLNFRHFSHLPMETFEKRSMA